MITIFCSLSSSGVAELLCLMLIAKNVHEMWNLMAWKNQTRENSIPVSGMERKCSTRKGKGLPLTIWEEEEGRRNMSHRSISSIIRRNCMQSVRPFPNRIQSDSPHIFFSCCRAFCPFPPLTSARSFPSCPHLLLLLSPLSPVSSRFRWRHAADVIDQKHDISSFPLLRLSSLRHVEFCPIVSVLSFLFDQQSGTTNFLPSRVQKKQSPASHA